jgi:nucleotide-binding universal stress UspA family protein
MPTRCILVPTASGLPIEHCLDAALHIAQRAHAHVTALFVRPNPVAVGESFPDLVEIAGLDLDTIERSGKEAASRARASFEAWCAARRVPTKPSRRLDATFACWREETGDLDTLVALLGRVNDLIIVDGQTKNSPLSASALDASIFSSGRPVLSVGARIPHDLLRHVVVAWNGSLEGTRAVAQSISLLHDAEKVSIFTLAKKSSRAGAIADLEDYLRWHGVVAAPALIPPQDFNTVGEALLATCRNVGATMLVMGAYTRSRVRDIFLGGVTKHVLDNIDIPVLMAH